MRILYIGNYRHEHCTEVHLARDLENLGHTVTRFQEDPDWHLDERMPESLYDAVEETNADLVLWTRTWGLPPSATEFWRWCESGGIVTASYHLDLYFGLKRDGTMTPGSGDPFWTTGHTFTPDGNEASEARFRALGINHHWSPPAIVSDECVPGTVRPEWEHDVIFVGSRNYHPEWKWRRQLIDGLQKRYGDRFRHYGHSWETTVRTGLHDGIPEPGLWLNDLYASAKVVVGDTLNLPGNEKYISDRYFEVMGRGGCLVAPYVPVLSELGFVEGEHLITFDHYDAFGRRNDLSDVFRMVDIMLELNGERHAMARRAQTFVRENHTYKQRLARALEIMELA